MRNEIFEEALRIARKESEFVNAKKRKNSKKIERSTRKQVQNIFFNFPLKTLQKEKLYSVVSNGRPVSSLDQLTELEAWIIFATFAELLICLTTKKPASDEPFQFFGGSTASDY